MLDEASPTRRRSRRGHTEGWDCSMSDSARAQKKLSQTRGEASPKAPLDGYEMTWRDTGPDGAARAAFDDAARRAVSRDGLFTAYVMGCSPGEATRRLARRRSRALVAAYEAQITNADALRSISLIMSTRPIASSPDESGLASSSRTPRCRMTAYPPRRRA